MATLGEAFIEVHADTRPFAKELKAEVTAILKKLDATATVHGRTVGESVGKGVRDGLADKADDITTTFWQRLRGRLRRVGADAGEEFSNSFQRLATSNFILFRVIGGLAQRMGALFVTLRRVGGEVFHVGRSLLQANKAMLQLGFQGMKSLLGLTNNFADALSSAQQAGSQLTGALASLATSVSSGAIGLAAMAAAAILLTSVLAALAAVAIVALAPFAQLLNFALLFPAALGILAGVIAPLVIALHGLGDAMELVFERDPKKFAEGFAKLTPTMRQLTTLLRRFVPLFRSIQRVVQENFLGPIIVALGPLLTSIGKRLQNGLSAAAAAMGIFVADSLRLLSSPAFTKFIDELFPSIARMIETMSPALMHLMSAMATATTAALPVVELLLGKLGGFIDRFATWIETTVADGRFQQFLDDAVASAGAIWDLIWALIGLFAEMFAQTDEGGRKFLEKITKAVNEFTKWLRSPDGKKALQDAVVLALVFAEAFRLALGFIRIIVTQLSNAFHKAVALLELIGIIERKNPGATIHNRQPANSFSGGGVVGYDQMAMVHKGEPILDPANSAERNRGILAEAGMLDLLPQPTVTNVYVGNEKLAEYVDYRVGMSSRGSARSLTYGTRRS